MIKSVISIISAETRAGPKTGWVGILSSGDFVSASLAYGEKRGSGDRVHGSPFHSRVYPPAQQPAGWVEVLPDTLGTYSQAWDLWECPCAGLPHRLKGGFYNWKSEAPGVASVCPQTTQQTVLELESELHSRLTQARVRSPKHAGRTGMVTPHLQMKAGQKKKNHSGSDS